MIFIGSDHGGYALKEALKAHLAERGVATTDCGVFSGDAADYPDIAREVCAKVRGGDQRLGILVCGTGIGVSIAANKVKGIRAALLHDSFTARMAREHNDANVICFGGRTTTDTLATEMLDAFLDAEFQGGRHLIRVDKIMSIEGDRNETER